MGRVFIAMSRNLLVRVGAAAAVVFVLLGVVTGALPVGCFAGGSMSCSTNKTDAAGLSPAAVTTKDAPANLPVMVADAPTAETVVAVPPDAAPTLTQNELVAATFALLPPELLAPPAAVQPANGALPTSTTPAVRVVKTTPIRIQQTQVAETPAVVAAASIAGASQPQTTDAVSMPIAYANELAPTTVSKPEAEASSSEMVAKADSAAPTPPAKASGGTHMRVTGKGANVRSSPSKGKSTVLFALNGGASVSVGENLHGWLHVTDERGRSGWLYKDFLQ